MRFDITNHPTSRVNSYDVIVHAIIATSRIPCVHDKLVIQTTPVLVVFFSPSLKMSDQKNCEDNEDSESNVKWDFKLGWNAAPVPLVAFLFLLLIGLALGAALTSSKVAMYVCSSFAWLILVAINVEPPVSGWLSISTFRWASRIRSLLAFCRTPRISAASRRVILGSNAPL